MSEDEVIIDPCPFCNTDNAYPVLENTDGKGLWQVTCLNCNASGPRSAEENVAIARWNLVVEKGTR